MAKALFGHVGLADARSLHQAGEVRRLRARVAELEEQLEQACHANEELHRSLRAVTMDERELLRLDAEPVLEPALT